MSFKRDRDDHGALGCLKKRRVEDLLGEDVPADEVSRLSNGRLACLVCNHRPIFDTLSILYVHRQGKRHLASAAYRDQKQQELSALVEKRAQEEFVKTGSAAALHSRPPSTLHQGLVLGAPYDPRVKKHKRKPYDRKSRLDLHGSQDITKPMLETRTQAPVATDTDYLPGNQMESGHQGYKKGRKIKTDITLGNNGHTQVRVTSQTQIKHVEQTETQPDLQEAQNTGSSDKEGTVMSENSAARSSLQEQDIQRAEKLRMLAGSGWKKDWDGRWIRDDDAEFDSDEEPPDIT